MALHEKDDHADSNMSLSPILVYLSDIVICLNQKGEVIEFNQAAEQYYGLKKAETLGRNYIEICKKNGLSYHPLLDKPQAITQQNNPQEFISTIVINSGQKHSASWKVVPIFDTKNKITAIFLVGKDITQEKIVEKGVKNIEKHLEFVIESIAGNHWWKDVNGRYMGCNDTVAKLLGLNSAAEIIGKTDYDLPWADTAHELIKNDQEVMKNGVAQTREEQATAKDGRVLTFFVTKVPLRDESGKVIGTIGTSIGITDRKRAEEREKLALTQAAEARVKAEAEAELRQAVMVLSGSIAHDLRTPIGIVEMRGDTLKKYLPTLIEAYYQAKAANLSFKDELPSRERRRKWELESFETMGAQVFYKKSDECMI